MNWSNIFSLFVFHWHETRRHTRVKGSEALHDTVTQTTP